MAGHSRDWWLHESEHVLVVLLLAVVLFQAAQVSGDTEQAATIDEQVMIVPATASFTAYTGQAVQYPWMVINRVDETVEVTSGVEVGWEPDTDNGNEAPGSVTALLVDPAYIEVNAIQPGSHKAYEYTFTAPEEPGEYRLTLVAEGDGADVREPISMTVIPPE